MPNSLVCVLLLMFPGAVRLNREPFNFSYWPLSEPFNVSNTPLEESFVFDRPIGAENTIRSPNASRPAVARKFIEVYPDVMRCDQNGGFPDKKMMLGDFIMLVHDEQLYFFYQEFHVQMSVPVVGRLFDDHVSEEQNLDFTLVHDFPFRFRKSLQNDEYGQYKIVTIYEWHKVNSYYMGSGEVVWKPEDGREKETKVFLDPVPGLDLDQSYCLTMDFSHNDQFGNLRKHHWTRDMLRKPNQFTFLRYDPQKWLEIIYTNSRTVTFQLWDYKRKAYTNPAIRGQLYEVKAAVYFELDEDHWTTDDSYGWSGYMVERDTVGAMHFHHYTFKWSRFHADTLVIDQHLHYEMPILDFFNCRFKTFYPLRHVNQLKGIIIGNPIKGSERGSIVTYVFIDVFYFAFEGDLLVSGLNINDPMLKKWAFDLEFEGTPTPAVKFDRTGQKFVKYLRTEDGTMPVFTFHSTETYKISDRSHDDRIYFEKTSYQAHLCPHSIFTVQKAVICAHKQHYEVISLQGYDDIGGYRGHQRWTFSDLFHNSTVNYSPDSHIEYIFTYKEHSVVFVTYHWLLMFQTEKVFSLKLGQELSTASLELTNKRLDQPVFFKWSNCIWTSCEPSHSHLDDVPLAPINYI